MNDWSNFMGHAVVFALLAIACKDREHKAASSLFVVGSMVSLAFASISVTS